MNTKKLIYMKPFLRQVAEHYAGRGDDLTGKTLFVFPSRRAGAFFSRYKRNAGWHGRLRQTSVNEFFYAAIGSKPTDRISLILTLYEVYRQVKPAPEPLDEFIHWGEVMIGDFDDIDKYMVDAKALLVDVADYKAIQESLAFLTDEQREAIEHFVAHFRSGAGGRLTVDLDDDSVKARFLSVWNCLAEIYRRYNALLDEKGMAYEGKVYRMLAERIRGGEDVRTVVKMAFGTDIRKVVFVGLNALNECEKTVLRALQKEGLAEFCWDFSSEEIRDPRNKASLFLKDNVVAFPPAFLPDIGPDALSRPDVTAVGVPSGVAQAKYTGSLLSAPSLSGEDTVVVLADEGLLLPLLSALPETLGKVNVTMGYPVAQSAVHTLVHAVVRLQVGARKTPDGVYFHHGAVEDLLSCSLLSAALGEDGRGVAKAIRTAAKAWVPASDAKGSPLLETLFTPVVDDPAAADSRQNKALGAYLAGAIAATMDAVSGLTDDDARMEREFADRYRDILDRIGRFDLPVMPATWMRLLERLLAGESLPFDGDRLEGLQVMGSLETRALDFRHVVIVGANEDRYPGRSTAPSFIPPELRKGFGMPTYEFQDGIWAYYFYRLIQRAETVTMVYDTRTDGLLSGEESRYIKQLEMLYAFPVKHETAEPVASAPAREDCIPKTEDDITALRQGHLSASAMQSYLYCPARFYYQSVKGLREDEEAAETLDAAALGTVFHAVMETLYGGRKTVTMDYLQGLLHDAGAVRTLIRERIMAEMKTIDVTGRNLVIEEVILEYVRAVLRYDIGAMKKAGRDEIRIIGLEKYLEAEIDGFRFIGFIDRMDSIVPGQVRVIDYKTGHVEDDDIRIDGANAASVVDKLFGESNVGRPKIALQLYLYDEFVHGALGEGSVETVVNAIYSTARLLTRPLPEVPECNEFKSLVRDRLAGTLREIADTSVPWKRTEDRRSCQMCPFRAICGR